jgi:hypothetical protein
MSLGPGCATTQPRSHPQRGRSHDTILVNVDDAIIVILSDAQQAWP